MENNTQPSGSGPAPDGFNSQPSQPSAPGGNTQLTPQPKKKKKWLWIGLGIGVILVGVFAFNLMRVMNTINSSKDGSGGPAGSSGSKAADKLYDALGNAVGQRKVRVAMLRATYANKADADSQQHKGTEQSTVAAMDGDNGDYANVFAFNAGGEGKGYSVGRCVGKVPYINTDDEAAGIATIAAAAERLKQPVPATRVGSVSDSCAQFGVPPGALPHLAWARLSDGIMPVTLESAQGKDWANKMKGTGLFTVNDEGKVTRNGQELRKFSFKPKVESNRVGVTLTEIFEQASDLERLQQEHPNAKFDYAFIPLSATIASGMEGFYLINEKTNLPVYSEINTIAKDKVADGTAPSKLNLARTKQTYSYGTSPSSINLNTPLELLK